MENERKPDDAPPARPWTPEGINPDSHKAIEDAERSLDSPRTNKLLRRHMACIIAVSTIELRLEDLRAMHRRLMRRRSDKAAVDRQIADTLQREAEERNQIHAINRVRAAIERHLTDDNRPIPYGYINTVFPNLNLKDDDDATR